MSETKTPHYAVDQIVKFIGYKSELPKGMSPILKEGQLVKLLQQGDTDDSFKAGIVGNLTVQDTVFLNEIEPAPVAKRARPAPAAAETEAEAETETEAETEAEEKPARTRVKAAAPKKVAPKKEKTKAEKPAKEKKKEIVIPDSASVQTLLESQDALEAAKELHTQIEESYFTFGGVLSFIRRNKSHETITNPKGKKLFEGADGFSRYVEAELDVKYRKAMYLIDIYEHFSKLGIDEKELTQIGWSKASQLARVADNENFSKLLKYAKTHSKEEVEDHVKDTIVKAGGTATAKKTQFSFRLFEDKAEVAKQALTLAGQKIDSEDASEQFDFIVTEWLQVQEGAEITKEQAIAHIETKYGISLSVVVNGVPDSQDQEATA